MPNPRKTVAPPAPLSLVLPLVLVLFLLPPDVHAAPGAPERDTAPPAGLVGALATAWDWLLSLAEPPEEGWDGAVDHLPAWNEGSHLDPNGGY